MPLGTTIRRTIANAGLATAWPATITTSNLRLRANLTIRSLAALGQASASIHTRIGISLHEISAPIMPEAQQNLEQARAGKMAPKIPISAYPAPPLRLHSPQLYWPARAH